MYASCEFGAERKMLNSSVIVRGEDDEKEQIWMAKVLWLCRRFVKRDADCV